MPKDTRRGLFGGTLTEQEELDAIARGHQRKQGEFVGSGPNRIIQTDDDDIELPARKRQSGHEGAKAAGKQRRRGSGGVAAFMKGLGL